MAMKFSVSSSLILAALPMKRACCLGAMLLLGAISIVYPQSPSTAEPQPEVKSFPDFAGQPLNPRCAEISDMGPQFRGLVNACEYAMSPESLPNLVCRETIQRSARGSRLDVVTEEVTFQDGQDHYSNYAINGKPVSTVDNTRGWNSDALFGTLLNAVFFPATNSKFGLSDKPHGAVPDLDQFTFQYYSNRSPAFHFADADPGMSGSIWINRSTGLLARVETTATMIDPLKPLKSYSSTIDYGSVLIADLGYVLLPTKATVQACWGNACFRNIASFHDCRRFASTVRILPTP
jgi:hypothetical protein